MFKRINTHFPQLKSLFVIVFFIKNITLKSIAFVTTFLKERFEYKKEKKKNMLLMKNC